MNAKSLRKSFTFQHDQSDCGIACLTSIIKYHGGEASLETLRKTSGTSQQGTTLLGLLQSAQQHGFDAEGLEAEGVDNLKELSSPAILHVLIDNRLQHYLVFYGFENQKVVIGDPAKGIIEYTYEQLNTVWQSKTLLQLTPNKNFEHRKTAAAKRKRWIIELVREDYPLLLLSLFLGLITSSLGISTAIFSQKLIDEILPKGDVEKLTISFVVVLLLLLARTGLNYMRGFFMARQGMEFNNRIIQSFYSSLLRLPKSFFDTRKTGELIARMNDTSRIQATLAVLVSNVIVDVLIILVSTCFVFMYTSVIGITALAFLVLFILALLRFTRPIAVMQKELMGEYAKAESNFVDTIQGITDVKLSDKIVFFENLNKGIYGLFQQRSFELSKLGLRFGAMADIIGVFFIVACFGICSWLVLGKELLLGEMIAVLGIAGGIIPSAIRLVIANIQLQEARIAFDRMFEFTSIEKEDSGDPSTGKLDFNELEIKSISFRFPGRKQILKNVSLTINKGQIIALLGESGGGKSTMLQLIQKFYKPESGAIVFNDIDSSTIGIADIREQIGYVPQDLKIFNGNLLFNITLSESTEDYQKAISFCEQSGLGEFFQSFPQGYVTLLGEEGVNISGGQKQLVVLARALFRQPKLLLLDEATSAMDRNTENFILALLQKLKSEMGILMVTHRIKTAQRCDRIYILENGLISAEGTVQHLMQSDNFFSESYRELLS